MNNPIEIKWRAFFFLATIKALSPLKFQKISTMSPHCAQVWSWHFLWNSSHIKWSKLWHPLLSNSSKNLNSDIIYSNFLFPGTQKKTFWVMYCFFSPCNFDEWRQITKLPSKWSIQLIDCLQNSYYLHSFDSFILLMYSKSITASVSIFISPMEF